LCHEEFRGTVSAVDLEANRFTRATAQSVSCRTVPANSKDSSTSAASFRWSRSIRANAQLRTL
jgi:hypothetical protein